MVWESVYMELTSTNTILYLFTIARQQLTPVDVRVLATIRLPSELVCNKTKTTVKDRREEEKVPMQSKVYNFLVYFYFLAICHYLYPVQDLLVSRWLVVWVGYTG